MSEDTEVVSDETTQEVVEAADTPEADSLGQELGSLKEELRAMRESQASLMAQLKPKEEKKPDLTEQEIKAMQSNPRLAAEWLKSQAEIAKAEIQAEAKKTIHDQNAYNDFPALKTDESFKKEVVKQMREFTQTGEYNAHSPMLLYRAAQIVAGKVGVKANTGKAGLTSEAPAGRAKSTVAQKTAIAADDPRVRFAKLFGMDPKKVEKFKTTLDPYVPSTRPKARRIG